MLAEVQARHSTLYVTGEESLTQVHLRAKRLGLTRLDLPVLAETGVEQIIAQLQAVQPALVVIDSIQTLSTDKLDRSEEHTSELQSLMRISYAVFCLKKKHNTTNKCTKYTNDSITTNTDKRHTK